MTTELCLCSQIISNKDIQVLITSIINIINIIRTSRRIPQEGDMCSFNPTLKHGVESTDLPHFFTQICTDHKTHFLLMYTFLKIVSMAKKVMKINKR
jgi:hypothetical protein